MSTQHAESDFENPSVVEVVLGVEFNPLAGWDVPLFGLFWQGIRAEYPDFQTQPPIMPSFGFSSIPIRCWFIDATKTRLVQIQQDRILFNWRKIVGDETFPRFRQLLPTFLDILERFHQFMAAQGLGAIDIRLCEVTYVDHIVWDHMPDLATVIPFLSGDVAPALPPARPMALSVAYGLPEDQGQLSVQFQPAIRARDSAQVVQMTTSTKSKPASGKTDDIRDALKACHDWGLRAFLQFTSTELQESWKRRG